MPNGKFYRKQARLFAGLAVNAGDPQVTARLNAMAFEQLARADEASREAEAERSSIDRDRAGGNGTDRD